MTMLYQPSKDGMTRLTAELHGMVTDVTNASLKELDQVKDLIAQAIAVLDCSFSAIAVGTDVQQQTVAELLGRQGNTTTSDDDLNGQLQRNSQDINENVAAAIRSLQFEDMVRQVVEHTRERLEALGTVTDSMTAQAELLAEQSPDHPEIQIDKLHQQLQAARTELRESKHRAVTQTTMNEGDIDLF